MAESESKGSVLPSEESKLLQNYKPKNKIRFVTATALFDGHDASINIMRRLLQARGVEVIHLGHNRSAKEIVDAALQEDAQGIAISSYQGGHMEFFKYIRKLLNEANAPDVKIFGGGGGVITVKETEELHKSGITRIYSPEDGTHLGLDGIIGHMIRESDFEFSTWSNRDSSNSEWVKLSRAITLLESKKLSTESVKKSLGSVSKRFERTPVIGITGTGGAGKSSITDELISRFLWDNPEAKIGLLCIDPSKKSTGGALLGDRIRVNSASNDRVFLRSFATRGSGKELADATKDAIALMKERDFDFIVVETSGIGQGDTGILDVSEISIYVMTCEFGAQTQLEKIDMLDFADLVAVNKFERRQALDALRDVRTQLRRTRFKGERVNESQYPVFGTIASRFNDDGTNGLYQALCKKINQKLGEERFIPATNREYKIESSNRNSLIPGDRTNYLSDISRSVRQYHDKRAEYVDIARKAESLERSAQYMQSEGNPKIAQELKDAAATCWKQLPGTHLQSLEHWSKEFAQYNSESYSYQVRGKEVKVAASFTTLSQLQLPKIALPRFRSKAEILDYILRENTPGSFPFTGGVYPFRRTEEDPKRQFAGEGGPSRTNARFHYLSKNDTAKRLSTAFDSVTLYGAEPDKRPDIYGKIGESGVSIATLDDMKVLYSGFDLCAAATSVSMTINGPAPIILAMFLNTAVDQQIDAFVAKNKRPPTPIEHQEIYDKTLQTVRGTVQADILKEDQAQNTCIFSTEFALKLMGDMQQYFIEKSVRNYYSVSISGYHIAEAGANPISQLAFTLANGFTYVEYYLSRGMKIDDFAPNLSFFFSNGLDAEYSVIGRVARRIWAIAMRDIYSASERSQMLKYHIQTSGRSLHAMEIDFNDIRTSLQALLALYDNCNSLHTNAYDEAITTPTEESVRRAMAIQIIINKEFGPNKCENINQGSYFLDLLTDAVEEAVLTEFDRLTARGGVLGAMETQYQRSKIQEESLYYEELKHTGKLPIIGVNTYLNSTVLSGDYERPEIELARASYDEKDDQLKRLQAFKEKNNTKKEMALKALANSVLEGRNVFAELMNTVKHASLGEISDLLYRVGGKYRRSM
ncbi:MAG: methylmalonyl-CoA mutase family protein [Proteobacteria bacterium]|nr:methylmalonyl-CoA mutase family protein [Pseudomonadota bacterium]